MRRGARATGVAPRALDGARDQSRARGVSRADAALGHARVGRHGAHAGARGRGRLVPSHLPDRETGRTPMAARATFTALGSALVLSTLAAGGALAPTSVSVYADGRVVVRRALPQPLDKGRNTVVLKEASDPRTIFSPDTAVALVAAQARGAATQQEALARARGQTLAFVREKDTIRATVVSVEPPPYRLGGGRLPLATPGTPQEAPVPDAVLARADAHDRRAGRLPPTCERPSP